MQSIASMVECRRGAAVGCVTKSSVIAGSGGTALYQMNVAQRPEDGKHFFESF
jgi:hypothetical protein